MSTSAAQYWPTHSTHTAPRHIMASAQTAAWAFKNPRRQAGPHNTYSPRAPDGSNGPFRLQGQSISPPSPSTPLKMPGWAERSAGKLSCPPPFFFVAGLLLLLAGRRRSLTRKITHISESNHALRGAVAAGIFLLVVCGLPDRLWSGPPPL
jgi:hypothetical protein